MWEGVQTPLARALQGLSEDIDNPVPESQRSEATLQYGVCLLDGIGADMDIDEGLRCIVRAAETGSTKARSMVYNLFRAYDRDIPPHLPLEAWLIESARKGWKWAVQGLRTFKATPKSVPAPELTGEYTCSIRNQWGNAPDYIIDFREHIQPCFDLSDPETLKKQLSKVNQSDIPLLRLVREREDGVTVNAVIAARDPTSRHCEKCKSTHRDLDPWDDLGTLLHWAVFFDMLDAVTILLDEGCDPDTECWTPGVLEPSSSPLQLALGFGYGAIADLLLKHGASVSKVSKFSCPFCYLVFMNDQDAVRLARLFVSRGYDVNQKVESERYWHHTSMTERGWLDDYGSQSITPLRWAIMNGSSALVRVLIELGAQFPIMEPLARGAREHGPTAPLSMDSASTDAQVLELFLDYTKNPDLLHQSWSETPLGLILYRPECCSRRLNFGESYASSSLVESILSLSSFQKTPMSHILWVCCRFGHRDLLGQLLSGGIDVETRWRGLSPLHTAVLYGHTGICKLLLEHGADATALTSSRGVSVLHLLFWRAKFPDKSQRLMNLLLEHNADVNGGKGPFNCGVKPIHLAVVNGDIPGGLGIVRQLVERGASITDGLGHDFKSNPKFSTWTYGTSDNLDRVTIEGCTPLGIAITANHRWTIRQIVELFDIFDWTPAKSEHILVNTLNRCQVPHLIAGIPRLSMSPLFDRVFARETPERLDRMLSARDTDGDTPLHYAAAAGYAPTILRLRKLGASTSIRNIYGMTPLTVSIRKPFVSDTRGLELSQAKSLNKPADWEGKKTTESSIEALVRAHTQELPKKAESPAVEKVQVEGWVRKLADLAVVWDNRYFSSMRWCEAQSKPRKDEDEGTGNSRSMFKVKQNKSEFYFRGTSPKQQEASCILYFP